MAKSKSKFLKLFRHCVLALVVFAIAMAVLVFLADARVNAQGAAQIRTLDELSGQPSFDCVIVPGALVYDNGRPSSMLQDRLDMAIQIYQNGLTDRILVSGDHGQADYNEVGVMRQYLLEAGIPEEHIFMDHAGFDTYDTVYRAQSIFGVRRALITTQDFHLIRALYIGRQLGLDLQGTDCGYNHATEKARYRIREYPARFKAFLDCEVFGASPAYTGDTIPISGDGRLTLD